MPHDRETRLQGLKPCFLLGLTAGLKPRPSEFPFMRLFLASSNPGKLREYVELALGSGVAIELLPRFGEFPSFEESAPTFAENAAGKALHYSRFTDDAVLADDSGLVVPALGGAPGVYSARYAGPGATDADRVEKLLGEMRGKAGMERRGDLFVLRRWPGRDERLRWFRTWRTV